LALTRRRRGPQPAPAPADPLTPETEPTVSDLPEVIDAIASMGRTDLGAVFEAYRARMREVRQYDSIVNKASMPPGTRVVTQNLKPRYLNGMRGTVADGPARRAEDIVVIVDEADRNGRERYVNPTTGQVGVPATCLRAEA
jgi:hypothetical protein